MESLAANTDSALLISPPPRTGPKYKISARPHMSDAVVDILAAKMKGVSCYLEYGCGGSTRMAAQLGVPVIYSVESDKAFARAVERAVRKDDSDSSLFMNWINIGPTKEWGRPDGKDRCRLWPDYPLNIWDVMEEAGHSPDLVLVDGRFRAACFLASMLRAKPGTEIVFDDYVGREKWYSGVEKHIQPVSVVDTTAIFVVPDSVDLLQISLDMARQCFDPN